uniref:vWA domain-containing protein n=1 Tax=Sporichthya sp. TaxID=65475 RepID=UPI00180521F5
VRAMLRRGGEPAELPRRRRKDRPRRIVLLLDVSGSMEPYAEAYLRFAHTMSRKRPQVEAFTIGTRLTRITRALSVRDPDAALRAVSAAVPDWSGGTRLGDLVKAFLDRWGQRGMARGAVVVIASDGWERGEVELLATQMQRLHRLARAVVWVNPHVGKDGFAPTAAGMQAALPFIDGLVAGHSVAAFDDLARLLSEDLRSGALRQGLGARGHASVA